MAAKHPQVMDVDGRVEPEKAQIEGIGRENVQFCALESRSEGAGPR